MSPTQVSASILLITTLIGTAFFGCTARDPASPGPADKALGALSVRIAVDAKSPFKSIAKSGEILVSAQDMTTQVSKLTIGDSTITGKVTGIPTGKDRRLEVKVYDSAGTVRYQGSAATDIIADSTSPVSLTLYRKTGSTAVTGIVSENDSTQPPLSTPWGAGTRIALGAQGHATLGATLDLDEGKAWFSAVANANQSGIDLVFLYYQGTFHLDNAVQAKAAGVANTIYLTNAYDDSKIRDIAIVKIVAKPADQEAARKAFAAGAKIRGSTVTAGEMFLVESTEGKLVLVTVTVVAGTDNRGAAEVELGPLTIP
jgi:hypothetical protein